MRKDLVISCTRHETKVAILEDEQLVEIYFERPNEYSLVGSVHKGRVTRVLPGMQAAFVNIGLERDAFLYVSDFFEPSDEVEPIEIASPAEVTAEIQPPVEPAASATHATEVREKEKSRRDRRRRRRGLPREKYVEPAEESKEFVILPGESLAKYGTAPAREPQEELVEAELTPTG
ncbi:MAG: ribonuclease, partial [Thermoleophilia bacterium]|nr:ribonuclease [Thermoleophilia bacterium]